MPTFLSQILPPQCLVSWKCWFTAFKASIVLLWILSIRGMYDVIEGDLVTKL
jgi:hypothetical protein